MAVTHSRFSEDAGLGGARGRMEKGYKSFLEQNGSVEAGMSRVHPLFTSYMFSSEIGEGCTSIYEVDSYASICIARHVYRCDFEYAVQNEDSIAVQQYDSIVSERSLPDGDVQAGMHYIERISGAKISRFKIKKAVPACVVGIQLIPDYYEEYLKKNFRIQKSDLNREIIKLPRGIYIPELSFIFNQIKSFRGSGNAAKLFYKSKIDEAVAVIFQKAEEIEKKRMPVHAADYEAISAVLEYIHTRLDKALFLPALAKKACMSPSKFKYVFKAVTQLSLSQYLFNKRMDRACDLLINTNKYIAAVAQETGYKNAGSFSAQFKKYTGVLPAYYRTKNMLC